MRMTLAGVFFPANHAKYSKSGFATENGFTVIVAAGTRSKMAA